MWSSQEMSALGWGPEDPWPNIPTASKPTPRMLEVGPLQQFVCLAFGRGAKAGSALGDAFSKQKARAGWFPPWETCRGAQTAPRGLTITCCHPTQEP